MNKHFTSVLKPSVIVIDEPWDSNIQQAEWEKKKQALMQRLPDRDEKASLVLQANVPHKVLLRDEATG